jgi:hypothetical protein
METSNCCSLIDPVQYEGRTFDWTGQHFLKARIYSFLHMPLTFGSAMKKLMRQAELAKGLPAEGSQIWLTDENSPWGADLYLLVTKPVSGAQNASVGGSWRARVFDGPFKKLGEWYKAVQPATRFLAFYTACPKCAKKFGHNYVVLFTQ